MSATIRVIAAVAAAGAGSALIAVPAAASTPSLSIVGYPANTPSYALATHNRAPAGSGVELKKLSTTNASEQWYIGTVAGGKVAFLTGPGYAITNRGTSVFLESMGNYGAGFASQKWTAIAYGGGTVYQNVKTGLYLAPTSTGQYAPVTVNAGMNGQPTQPDAWALPVAP
ncbi:MAG TPA: hypothetical protein VMH35_01315 [Streptosporangiaceae bacterium]|nr:hypothetical protein [Streptosporangiaceae bacterium]